MRHLITKFSAIALSATICAFAVPNLSVNIAHAQETASINRGPSGLPLPRFVSLKTSNVRMRVGPGTNYAVSWLYLKQGEPLEIIQEYDNWRRVRDAQGTTGWIHGSLLSGKRTAIATPWMQENKTMTVTVFAKPEKDAQVLAYIQPGVLAQLDSCDGAWCAVEVKTNDSKRTLSGFTNQVDLWGAYPDEKIKN